MVESSSVATGEKPSSLNRVFMALVLTVQWVEQSNQPEPHLRIRHIGGVSGQLRWKHTQAEAVEAIERGLFAYYFEWDARPARPVKLEIAQAADGRKYLTVGSGQSHALLDLPEFPDSVPDANKH